MRQASYIIAEINEDTVFLTDVSDAVGAMSVTNNAENVTAEINALYPGMRIVYIDTMGWIDELVHDNGKFQRFEPYFENQIQLLP